MPFKLQRILSYGFASASRGKFVFMFGPPGAGKGTYGDLLIKDIGYNKISTGDELRNIIKGKSESNFSPELVSTIKTTVASGGLVSDEIVLQILEEKLSEPASAKGVIIDGYPRTKKQLDMYSAKYPTDIVVNISLNLKVLVEKIIGRRVCNGCGKNYNVCCIKSDGYDMDPLLPEKEGVCDKCQGQLGIRPDDNAETVQKRLDEYNQNTQPLLNVYKEKGLLYDFEPKRGVKDYPKFYEGFKKALDAL